MPMSGPNSNRNPFLAHRAVSDRAFGVAIEPGEEIASYAVEQVVPVEGVGVSQLIDEPECLV